MYDLNKIEDEYRAAEAVRGATQNFHFPRKVWVSILTRAFARVQRPHSSVRAGQGSRGRLREPPQKGLRRRVGDVEGKTGFQCPLADFSACANPPGFWHLLGVRA